MNHTAAESTTSVPEDPARAANHFDFAKKIETDPDCYVDQIVLHPETGEPVCVQKTLSSL